MEYTNAAAKVIQFGLKHSIAQAFLLLSGIFVLASVWSGNDMYVPWSLFTLFYALINFKIEAMRKHATLGNYLVGNNSGSILFSLSSWLLLFAWVVGSIQLLSGVLLVNLFSFTLSGIMPLLAIGSIIIWIIYGFYRKIVDTEGQSNYDEMASNHSVRKNLTLKEKLQLARESREFFWRERHYANDRENRINDAIRVVELQIAAITLALAATFAPDKSAEDPIFSTSIFTGFGMIALVLSIVFGLINERVKMRFWSRIADFRDRALLEYHKVLLKEIDFEKAERNVKQLMGGVERKKLSSDNRPLILQTVLLAIGVLAIVATRLMMIFQL